MSCGCPRQLVCLLLRKSLIPPTPKQSSSLAPGSSLPDTNTNSNTESKTWKSDQNTEKLQNSVSRLSSSTFSCSFIVRPSRISNISIYLPTTWSPRPTTKKKKLKRFLGWDSLLKICQILFYQCCAPFCTVHIISSSSPNEEQRATLARAANFQPATYHLGSTLLGFRSTRTLSSSSCVSCCIEFKSHSWRRWPEYIMSSDAFSNIFRHRWKGNLGS